MKTRTCLLLAATLSAGSAWPAPQDVPSDPPGNSRPDGLIEIKTARSGTWLMIDGKAHPELIPDHEIWRTSLLHLASARPSVLERLKRILSLSKLEEDLVLKEAQAQQSRDATCRERLDNHWKEMTDRGEKPVDEGGFIRDPGSWAITLDCRQQTLDAADRLMARLSPEGQAALANLLEFEKGNRTIHLPAEEWESFKRPR